MVDIVSTLFAAISGVMASIAIGISLNQERLRKWWNRPKLEFKHEEKMPFRKENIDIIQNFNGKPAFVGKGTFERFSIENIGRGPAINCRCQIYDVRKNKQSLKQYKGFPLSWASRPEIVFDPLKGERLNIGQGETEFVNLTVAHPNFKEILLESYHTVQIGIPREIEAGEYEIDVISSGDNFKPYILTFDVSKEDSFDSKKLSVKLKHYTQKT